MVQWLTLLMTTFLSACVDSNEALEKKGAANIAGSKTLLSSEMENRSYYRLQTGYTCKLPAPGSPSVESWRGKITLKPKKGKYHYWNNVCNDAPLIYDIDPSKFNFTDGVDEFQYEGGTYRYLDADPLA